jgi:hypothetical protein
LKQERKAAKKEKRLELKDGGFGIERDQIMMKSP